MCDTASSVDQSLRGRFETALTGGESPKIEDYLPPESDPRYLATLEKLVIIELEFNLGRAADPTAERPRVEKWLARFPRLSEQPTLVRLLQHEYQFRKRRGEQPNYEDYQRRFPGAVSQEDLDRAADAVLRAQPAAALGPGDRIDRYKLLQHVGEGGFGDVYMAEQTEPVRRRVALKIVKPGMDSRSVVARFEAERQALAMMDHENIARVLDAGTTQNGRPYFVMELVKGIPIVEYCDRNKLPTRERIELFISVCQAIQHAHQKGIIHRDIKPSNILVTLYDVRPVPKVIDFGVAKALEQPLTEKTMFTQLGQVLGTPQYMSPEQAETNAMDVDTRSDIYSLGVLLYELLTGTTPIPKQEFRNTALDKLLHMIREQEPPKPSTRIHSSTETLATISQDRNTEPKKLGTLIRGDLDWIVMKALEKDRTRRYQTASEFAEDMTRYLDDEPVLAGPPSATYRLGKVIRKHRAAIMTTAAVGVLLLASTVVSTSMYFNANKARLAESVARLQAEDASRLATERLRAEELAKQRAEQAETEAKRQAQIATAVTNFLTDDMLGQADPGATPDRNMTLRTVLDQASAETQGRFAEQPLIDATVRRTIGRTYFGLGEYELAEPHLERSLELLTGELGEEHPDTLTTMNDLAELYRRQGRYGKAEPLYQRTLATRRRVLGKDHLDTLTSMNNLGLLFEIQGRYADAEQLYEQALEIQKNVLGEEHIETLTSMHNLAWLYASQGHYDKSEQLHAETLAIRRRVLGDDHPHTLYSTNSLAEIYRSQGRYAAAEPLYLKTLRRRKQVLGAAHPETLISMNNLALLYLSQGRYDEAEPLLEQALDSQRNRLGPLHIETLTHMSNLAVVYDRQDRFAEAESLAKQTLEGRRRVLGDDHPHTLYSTSNLAALFAAQQRYDEAETLARETYQARANKLGATHPETQTTLRLLCAALIENERFGEARPLCEAAMQWVQENEPENWTLPYAQTLLGMALAGEGQTAEGEKLLLEGHDALAVYFIKQPGNKLVARAKISAVRHLVELYEAQQNTDKVQQWQAELDALTASAANAESDQN